MHGQAGTDSTTGFVGILRLHDEWSRWGSRGVLVRLSNRHVRAGYGDGDGRALERVDLAIPYLIKQRRQTLQTGWTGARIDEWMLARWQFSSTVRYLGTGRIGLAQLSVLAEQNETRQENE